MPDVFQSAAAFNARLAEIGTDLPESLVGQLHRKVALDVLGAVIARTPVDSGAARGGWRVSNDVVLDYPTNPEAGVVGDPSGPTLERGASEIGRARPYSVTFISNSVPYIVILDQGGYVPADPDDDAWARYVRAKRRPQRARDRAQAAKGDPGATFVRGGYSFQAPAGIVALALIDAKDSL